MTEKKAAGAALDTQEVARAIQGSPGVNDWQIRRVRSERHELYVIGEDVESTRQVDGETAEVTIFHDRDGRRGRASLTLVPGGLDGLGSRIERAVLAASLALNPPYRLPGPSAPAEVEVRDPLLAERPVETIRSWSETLRRVAREEEAIRLAAAEFYVSSDEVEFQNSRGAAYRYPVTQADLEFVLISGREAEGGPAEGGRGVGPAESENFYAAQVRAVSDLDLEQVIRERAELARDMLRVTPPGEWTGPVVIDGRALAGLLEPFFARTAASYVYQKVFPTKVGDNLFGERLVSGDRLDLASDATLPYGLASAPADAEGLPGRRVPVLRDGRVEHLLATARYADYLGIEPTGGRANVVLGTGETSRDELLAGPVYHLVSFADLKADPFTGEFVSEIRLGYHVGADGRTRPVKGGTVSGNVFDAFAACRYSRETVKARLYHGPAAARFEKLVVSG